MGDIVPIRRIKTKRAGSLVGAFELSRLVSGAGAKTVSAHGGLALSNRAQ